MKHPTFFCTLIAALFAFSITLRADPVRVLVWDEQQPVKPKVYPDFPGNFIAEFLKKNGGLEVTSANIHEEEKGLSTAALERADVLVFWGHVRHDDISAEKSREIVDRVKEGKLAMITLHSAHWSVPFMVAMEDKVVQDALEQLPAEEAKKVSVKLLGKRERKLPAADKRIAFSTKLKRSSDGTLALEVERPNCVFPRCCTPKQPSQMRVILKDHPIAKGVPATFTIPATEMYDEPFHIPAPDKLVLDETWAGGEYFRSGALWDLGKGQVFYFRPGDQQYAVYKEEPVLKIIENACAWMGEKVQKGSK